MRLEPLQSHDDKMFLILGAISAGIPAEISGELKQIKLLEFLTGNSRGVFALRVCGDSMFPDIGDGDVVIVDSNKQPRFGENFVAGQMKKAS